MKKKVIAAALLSLAMTPCICLFACTGNGDNGDNGDKGNSGTNQPATVKPEAVAKLNAQVTGTEDTYTNIYGRAERNGGLFAVSAEREASVAKYALTSKAVADAEEETENTFDTTALIEQLYLAVKDGKNYNFQNKAALETYVIDVFAYTQIAQAIVSNEENKALTKTYAVDYEVNEEVYENLTSGLWSTKVPEEISFAGYDEASHKVNIQFSARTPKDKENNVNNFEKVNSEMYYLSDSDFGYAQFTYRYDSDGTFAGMGFDYFSMKEKVMLEINMYSSGKIANIWINGSYALPSTQQKTVIEGYLGNLEKTFTARTAALEQQNLALGVAAGIEGIETKEVNGQTVYVKAKTETPHHVSFDYEILKAMK